MSAPRHSVRTRNAPEQGDNQERKPVEAQVKDAHTAPLSAEIDSTNINSDTESTRAHSRLLQCKCFNLVELVGSVLIRRALVFRHHHVLKNGLQRCRSWNTWIIPDPSRCLPHLVCSKNEQRPRSSGVKSTVPGLPWSIFSSLGVCCLLFRPLPQRAAESVYK